jgi:hypothetical protein
MKTSIIIALCCAVGAHGSQLCETDANYMPNAILNTEHNETCAQKSDDWSYTDLASKCSTDSWTIVDRASTCCSDGLSVCNQFVSQLC